MAENYGLSKHLSPHLKDVPKKVPVKVVKKIEQCDVDKNCDQAQFEVIVRLEDETLSLYFCGHHGREKSLQFFERGYEVIKL